MSIIEIGCCGAYCRTCPAFQEQACKGCKLGYENDERDISKATVFIKKNGYDAFLEIANVEANVESSYLNHNYQKIPYQQRLYY